MERNSEFGRSFRRFGVITIIAVYVLIAVGSIVRMTGSGMGCPDWPRCFGQWIPPTDISQLPENYKTIFAVAGKQIADFNAFKTWIEYLNRLVGVLIGLFIFITLVLSIKYFRIKPKVFWSAFLAFILVGFEGWLGAKVVATNLQVGMITIHMGVALLIVLVLIYSVFTSFQNALKPESFRQPRLLISVLIGCLILTFVQIILGTQVREAIDQISVHLGNSIRETWLEEVGLIFLVHRSFSWLLLGINLYFVWLLHRNSIMNGRLLIWGKMLIILLLIELVSGVVMNYWAVPKVLQPVHLSLASWMLGIQFLILLQLNFSYRSQQFCEITY